MFDSLITFLDSVVVKDTDRVTELRLQDGWGDNVQLLDVFRKLNVKSFGDFVGDPAEDGAYNYIWIFLIAEDILAMMDGFKKFSFHRNGVDGHEDVLTWEEIGHLIFDGDNYVDLLSVTKDVRMFTLKMIMDRFIEILGIESYRKLPPSVWEAIVMETITDGHGGRYFGMPTLSTDQSGKEQELMIVAKVVTSMRHLHILLSRILFFGNYISFGAGQLQRRQARSVSQSKVRPHFDFRKTIFKRNVCQLYFHISKDCQSYMPSNVVGNLASIWNGSVRTSSYRAVAHPEAVVFCEGVSSLAAYVVQTNFWDPDDIRYGTVQICDLESCQILVRIRVEIRLLLNRFNQCSFHLSREEFLFVQRDNDGLERAGIRQWRYDSAQYNQEKFDVDLKIQLGSNMSFARKGYVGFLECNGTKAIGVCVHNVNLGGNSSRVIIWSSTSGEELMSMSFPNTIIEMSGFKHSRILLLDNVSREVIFSDIYSHGTRKWRHDFIEDEADLWSFYGQFDADDRTQQFVLIRKEGEGLWYELFIYKDPQWSEPTKIANGSFPMNLKDMHSSGVQLLNGNIYLLRENINATFCNCYRRKAVLGWHILAINCSDSTMHPIDCLSGCEVWVAATAMLPCLGCECEGTILINEANPRMKLCFSTVRGRQLHFGTKKKLYIDSNCFESSVDEIGHLVIVTFH